MSPPKRNVVAKDLRTPKYRSRVVKDKRKHAAKRACRTKENAE